VGQAKELSEMTVLQTVREMVDHGVSEKVFGSPLVRDGVTVLPVAKVSGGGGGGTGPVAQGREPGRDTGAGTGGGLGLSAKPLGVFVLKEGRVSWQPAVDVNRVVLGGQIVAVVALLVVRSLVRMRRRAERD
jgi:uncharacterized spore protein YtfJ